MDKLDKELRRMSKIEPSKGFISASKNRLMQQIALHQNETWFRSVLRRLGAIQISADFIAQARARLMYRIAASPQPIKVSLRGMALFLSYTKKAVASTMIMLIAVTSTLFFVEGSTVVEASDDSYLEIISGSASVKHPDLIIWEDVNNLIEVQAGDLIKTEEGSEVVIHFFDDTEIRLGENTEFLISQLAVSPTFGRQAIIEVFLHKGSAWVQTLNVEDGYAGLTFKTRDAVMKALNGTFNVVTDVTEPTSVYVLNNKVSITSLTPETMQAVKTLKLTANQKANVRMVSGKPVITTDTLTQQDRSTPWFQSNLNRDHEHLTMLREKGIERLAQIAGTLPGQMLYPIKQTKERLKLALSSDSDMAVQIEIANSRLNEALVLFEAGDQQKGREALMAYQSIARQIADAKVTKEVARRIIIPHQKTLTAELPNDINTGLVKETLHQTAEILANNPVELEKIRLNNSVQRLQDVTTLVAEGEMDAAKERLVSHQLAVSDALETTQAIEDEELKKEVLQEVIELKQEELTLLNSLTDTLGPETDQGNGLAAMVESASAAAEEDLESTMAVARPLIPELQETEELVAELSAEEIKMAELIDKIYIYNSREGQQNQIARLLKNELENTDSIDYLIDVRNHLRGRAYDYLNLRILQLQRKVEFRKHKATEQKIERSKKLREN
ncbi:FecR domain-containing protein [Patescibacteria group bacterium]|nr:FecR domain-containing protein [Patescibacteria group bacterium]MBU1684879.1 FecR domain-containing protein [Patescibacteria group bacterium]MBU1938663.1 FecR domain-containing protein [Patescibacteria group bacterium]